MHLSNFGTFIMSCVANSYVPNDSFCVPHHSWWMTQKLSQGLLLYKDLRRRRTLALSRARHKTWPLAQFETQ
jgi:hypothetical protein